MNLVPSCAYEGCQNMATGRCEGYQTSIFSSENDVFGNDCGQYFCQEHLKIGCLCIVCPRHRTGIHRCVIL